MNAQKNILYLSVLFAIGVSILFIVFTESKSKDRWYSKDMVIDGAVLFNEFCADCHGENAEGTLNWKKTNRLGKYPPPPLNGSAHAWHHDVDNLKNTIMEGGVALGGTMPPFKDKLSDEAIESVIAYFQSKWPDHLYGNWATRIQRK